MPIQVLAPDVAAKIAAGEVVERPASVVKELLENSLDAGATEIRVEIREGGQRLLRVSDNGHGMPADEAALAFQCHATSKLSTADDLNHIATFGFRGEALYSIAAVSQVTLTTRRHSEPFGAQIRLEGGVISGHGKAGAPVGTVVSVEHLFYNMPARKKFLRKAVTEAGQITTVLQRYALAHPDRRFSLINDGRLVFQSTGSGDLFDVLVKVYGLENAKQMAPVGSEQGEIDRDADISLLGNAGDDIDFMDAGTPAGKRPPPLDLPPPVLVSGYASLPTLTRANRSNIDLFVNRRYIEDRGLIHAVVQAYHTLLPVGRYPIAVLFVEIDPSQVDVNVHPQKTQVRFVEERRIFSAVQRATRQAIVRHAPVPDMNLGDYPPYAEQSAAAADLDWAMPSPVDGLSVEPDEQPPLDLWVAPQPISPLPVVDPAQRNWIIAGSGEAVTDPDAERSDRNKGESGENGAEQKQDAGLAGLSTPGRAPEPETGGRISQLPPLRVVGQVGALYIIAEGPTGLYLIDQHAAHERILYEKFMAQRYGMTNGTVAGQHLLEPLTLHVGHEVTGLVAHHLDELRAVGFEIEPFGGNTFLVRTVPSVLVGQDPLRALEEIVSSLANQRNLVGEELEARLVKMVCKRAAIKAGQLLSPIEMQELVRQLELCQSPRTCPHGRPTMIQLSAGELEKAFGRI